MSAHPQGEEGFVDVVALPAIRRRRNRQTVATRLDSRSEGRVDSQHHPRTGHTKLQHWANKAYQGAVVLSIFRSSVVG
jgi:hypothetical protein